MRHSIPAWVILLLACAMAHAVRIEENPAGGWRVTGKTYTASVDASATLTSLKIGDAELVGTDIHKRFGAAFPGGKPDSVNLRGGTMIAARNETARLEYTFDDTGVQIETEGAMWTCGVTDQATAFVGGDGSVRPGNARLSAGGIRRIIIGDTGLEFSEPFHSIGGRLQVSAVPSGKKKPGDPMKFRIELGISADATVLVEVKDFNATGKDPRVAPWYADNEKVNYTLRLNNLGAKDRQVTPVYRLGTHFGAGSKLGEPVVLPPLVVPAGKEQATTFDVVPPAPGVHWLNLELLVDDKPVKREQRAFVYAADRYRPPLTRPADFKAFWAKQLAELRAEDMNVRETEVPEKSSEKASYWQVSITVKGKAYQFNLSVPRKAGKHLAVFGGKVGDKAVDDGKLIVAFGHGGWPDSARFTRWAGESDNNLLDCYLVAVRITDYLRQRPDVDRIYLSGGSRQGCIQAVTAAIDPTRIVAAEIHVPTSLGVSWDHYAYKGWGSVPKPPSMAAYVDPVNFAPDMTVPFIMDLGAYDGLSPVPGGLAYYNYSPAKFKRFSVELGGHGYFTSSFKKNALAELEALLKTNATTETDDRVLKDH